MRSLTRGGRLAALLLSVALSASGTVLLGAPAAHAGGPNLVDNPGFENTGVPPYSTFTGSGGGLSAAVRWSVFNNGPATTTTDLLPVSTAPGGAARMLHVSTDGNAAGIVHGGIPVPIGSTASCSVWVFVTAGMVAMGCGATGLPGAVMMYSNPALNGVAWQQLTVPSSSVPVSEMVVYSRTAGTPFHYTDFYVYNAAVTSP